MTEQAGSVQAFNMQMVDGPADGRAHLSISLKPLHRHPIHRWRGLRNLARGLGANRYQTARVWLGGL
jgi:hypothetical protein